MFGGKDLILRRPFTYQMSKEGLSREFDYLCDKDCRPLQTIRNCLCVMSFDYPQYETFFNEILSKEVLIENRYLGDSFIFEFKDGEHFKISKGMKPMKIVHHLLEKYDTNFLTNINNIKDSSKYDALRIWHSQLFNQAHLDGELCLSIHPLDFLTMSDNANGWDSCMAWARERPGDYRAGTVECLNSPYIIIAYLHNPKHIMNSHSFWANNLIPDDWEWNSKRWRELFIVQEGIITEIKGYPYQDEGLTNTALMWIKELAHNNLGWDYNDEELNICDCIPLENGDDVCINAEPQYYMYNDFGTLAKHRMRINIESLMANAETNSNGFQLITYRGKIENTWHNVITIPYGGKATCMCCGQYLDEHESATDRVFCDKCNPQYRCACCGEYIDPDELCWIDSLDEPICEYCYETNTTYDEISEKVYLDGDSSLYRIYWGVEDDKGQTYVSNNCIITYDPWDNDDYNAFFTEPPKEITIKDKYFGWDTKKYYVTIQMAKDPDNFMSLFNIIDFDEEVQELFNNN